MIKQIFNFLIKQKSKNKFLETENVKNILIVRQHNQIGDLICSRYLFIALKKKYPNAKIILVASKTNYPIPFNEILPQIDKVLIYPKKPLKELIKFLMELRRIKYQIGIVPSTIILSRTSHILNFISGAKIRVGVSKVDNKKNKMSFLLNVKYDFCWSNTHQLERNCDIAKLIGCSISDAEKQLPIFKFNSNDENIANNYLNKNFPDKIKTIIAIHTGAGEKENIWSEENFIKLIQLLKKEFNCCFLLTEGPTDKNIISVISKQLELLKINFAVLSNSSLVQLALILKNVSLFISTDTGPMHVAAALPVAQISLFTKDKKNEWSPVGVNKISVQSSTKNINEITVEEIFINAKKLLKNF